MAKGKKSTEDKIKDCLTKLQKLVLQYYKERPDTVQSNEGNIEKISFYGSAVVGLTYNDSIGGFLNIANINLRGKNEDYYEIRSPLDYQKVK